MGYSNSARDAISSLKRVALGWARKTPETDRGYGTANLNKRRPLLHVGKICADRSPHRAAPRIPQDYAPIAVSDLGRYYQISIHPADIKSRY